MTATFHLQPGEIDENFLSKLRAVFHDREVEVVVHDLKSNPIDPGIADKIEDIKRRNPTLGSLIGVLKEPASMWDYLDKKYR